MSIWPVALAMEDFLATQGLSTWSSARFEREHDDEEAQRPCGQQPEPDPGGLHLKSGQNDERHEPARSQDDERAPEKSRSYAHVGRRDAGSARLKPDDVACIPTRG